MIKILIADDHAIVRTGLKQLLFEKYLKPVIGEADNAESLINHAIAKPWDLVICDLSMPGRSGLDALKQIKQAFPQLPVLIMSMYPAEQYATRALKAGASGYLSKDSIHENLIEAVETVVNGKKFITPSIAAALVEEIDNTTSHPAHTLLSDREFEVFKFLASGKTIGEISQKLSLGATTVSTYRSRILKKMEMRSNTDLARYAVEKNLI